MPSVFRLYKNRATNRQAHFLPLVCPLFAFALLVCVEVPAQQNPVMTLIPSVEPEQLRNVMPGSWQSLQRLTEAEEQAFITSHTAVLEEVGRFAMRELGHWWGSDFNYLIYRQQFATGAFYRLVVLGNFYRTVVLSNNDEIDFMSPVIEFAQALVFQGALLARSRYGQTRGNDLYGAVRYFESLDIIADSNGARGVLVTRMEVRNCNVDAWTDDPADWHTTSPRRNGQLYGTEVKGEYFPLNFTLREGQRSFEMQASDMLVDPIAPLRYGLQNAFDGNPSTAFVANGKLGLLGIMIHNRFLPEPITKFAIINGFAADLASYLHNNRIKTISAFSGRSEGVMQLTDNTLSWQVIESNSEYFDNLEVYPGERYNNTGVSGFNIFLENHGWLFGDIDER